MRQRKLSKISLFICFTMLFALMSTLWAQPVEAKSSRVAKIEEIVGVVTIKKAGGSKEFRAYKNMTLNSGDHISTGAKSSLMLMVLDQKDEITIGEKADLYISDLQDKLNGGKKTKLSMWGGSIWIKASSLVNSSDEFEIETPTAIMGVRGTNLMVGVDSETGESKFFIASGQGKVHKKGKEGDKSTTLNPNEQINLFKDDEHEDLDDLKNIADLDNLIMNTSNAIIEAIVASKQDIDEENKEYIEKLQNQNDGSTMNQETIDRINANLDNLVGNIVKNAITQNKVDKTEIDQLIEKVNKGLDKKIDLDNVKPQELSDAEKAKLAQLKLLEEDRKKKQEEVKKKQEELEKQNEALQQKLKEQLEKQKEEKEKAEEAAKKSAIDEYAKKLTDDAAKAAFEARLKAIEEQKQQQEERVKEALEKEKAKEKAEKAREKE